MKREEGKGERHFVLCGRRCSPKKKLAGRELFAFVPHEVTICARTSELTQSRIVR